MPLPTAVLSKNSRKGLMSFLRDRSGNFAMITAVMAIPLVGAVGLGIDYAMAFNLKNRLQQSTDAAALVLAREKNELKPEEAQKMAERMFKANFGDDFVSVQARKDGREWRVEANARSPNSFMQVLNGESIPVSVVSKAAHSTMSYEIALVLDTTGSMAGEKMKNLKIAANKMVETMSKNLEEKDRVKFSLVPFSTFVNVGPQFAPTTYKDGGVTRLRANTGARWLDLNGTSSAAGATVVPGLSRFRLFGHLGLEWKGCVETRQPTGTQDWDTKDLPVTGDPRSLFVPAFHLDDADPSWFTRWPNSFVNDDPATIPGVPSSVRSRMTKYGVPVDGGKAMETNWYKPTIDQSASTYYSNYDERKGPNFFCDSKPIVPLTSDYARVKDGIDSLEPLGNTNIFEGLMWGWRALSPGEPFTEGRPKDAFNNEKVIILLTDGNNAWNRLSNNLRSSYSSFGFLSQERLVRSTSNDTTILSAMDDKTLAGCTNAKKDGIVIYTIRLDLDDKNSNDLLQSCATDKSHYFDVPDSKALEETFEQIRYRINRIRLTH